MFERYTQKARRVIFYARHEAGQLGSSAIEAEHILLGVLRDDKQLAERLFTDFRREGREIRRIIESESRGQGKIGPSVDMPLSPSAREVLSRAAEESDRLGHRSIGPEHLMLALVKQGSSLGSNLLRERGVTAERLETAIDWTKSSSETPYLAGYVEKVGSDD